MARKTICLDKCEAERNRFADGSRKEDLKFQAFKTAKRIVKTNQNIIGERCMINNDSVLPVSDEDKKIAQKNYRREFLNTEFASDRN